ncbi:protease [Gossypium australe]|uniref:Protease n=1 Tax=Gossypium australe TaxID=47621 RepID=A0A5B6WHM0_9ROSI|nr:protease [Gossypium australe]
MFSLEEVVSNHREVVVRPEEEMVMVEGMEHRAEVLGMQICREDGNAPDVITGTFFIFGLPFTVLIVIGSTHSYVASIVSGTLNIESEIASREMTVISPLGQSVVVNKLFRNVPLEVQGIVFPADLMELPFDEFNLILGMD